MERTRDTENGQYNRTRSPDTILEEMTRGEVYSTKELADATNIPQRTALRYLNELAEQGRIEKELPNAKTAIWIRHE